MGGSKQGGGGAAGKEGDDDNERERLPVVLMLLVNGSVVAITDAEGTADGGRQEEGCRLFLFGDYRQIIHIDIAQREIGVVLFDDKNNATVVTGEHYPVMTQTHASWRLADACPFSSDPTSLVFGHWRVECSTILKVDPHVRCLAVHLFDRKVTIFPINSGDYTIVAGRGGRRAPWCKNGAKLGWRGGGQLRRQGPPASGGHHQHSHQGVDGPLHGISGGERRRQKPHTPVGIGLKNFLCVHPGLMFQCRVSMFGQDASPH